MTTLIFIQMKPLPILDILSSGRVWQLSFMNQQNSYLRSQVWSWFLLGVVDLCLVYYKACMMLDGLMSPLLPWKPKVQIVLMQLFRQGNLLP